MSAPRGGSSEPAGAWEAVIGLEIHVQLRTDRKLFCADSTRFGDAPNANVCPVCLGLPGALPVLNREAVELAVRAALAFGCEIHETSIFARKNYFYPDLPKGYQISQLERPLATGGQFTVDGRDGKAGAAVRIRRIHMEEDAGKSLHDRFPRATAVDLNRTGTPLIELVSEPDLRSPEDTRAYLQQVKQVLEYLDVSDCNMEEGSLRVDANVSVRPVGSEELGTKTEVKNMNSFSGVERAIRCELVRQQELLSRGGRVEHMTLLWDEVRGEVRPMRTKEESHDYRYFPDPDLPPLVLLPAMVERIRSELPELPANRRARFREEYGLPAYDSEVLTSSRALADYFEEVVGGVDDAKQASNWVMGPVMATLKERAWAPEEYPVPPPTLARVIQLVQGGTVSTSVGRDLLKKVIETGRSPDEIVEGEGLAQVRDEGQLEGWVDEILAAHPDEVSRFKGGEAKLQGYFMGLIMKASRGKADPGEVVRLLAAKLRR
ncbi:MAG: Asp-tRNA(Asn)/Glu-tRNA(Gln) amidotransferase subunit GatB [Gemmatimonadetes bacterium]|nr:Asp-tRNA(Asn)/Glu-tRNA(Gln) amidotransferase subunit GatB [Gemmatimonadota bacterium]